MTLTFWSWLPTADQGDVMIEAFEKENPDIKIDYVRTEQSDFFEKLQVAMASGTGPDLFGMTTGSMTEQYAPFAADMKELADQKTTMIIVTHEMAFARDVASHVIFMDDGCILEQGTPRQVFEHSHEERTRQFLSRFTQG